MAWGVERDELEPCPCGKGSIRVVQERDDWGWYRETQTMLCEDCKNRYVQKVFGMKDGRYFDHSLDSSPSIIPIINCVSFSPGCLIMWVLKSEE